MNMNLRNQQPGALAQVESLIENARRLGYRIRYDHFGGRGGGVCEFNGQKWIFLDVGLSAIEQLEMLEQEIAQDLGLEKDAGAACKHSERKAA